MPLGYKILAGYLLIISLIAVILTAADKARARKGKWRVPEATLFAFAALGGSAAMYIAMRCLHHKTRKRRFMWGIPLIFAAQVALILWLFAADIV